MDNFSIIASSENEGLPLLLNKIKKKHKLDSIYLTFKCNEITVRYKNNGKITAFFLRGSVLGYNEVFLYSYMIDDTVKEIATDIAKFFRFSYLLTEKKWKKNSLVFKIIYKDKNA